MTGIKTELGAANSQLQALRSEKSLLSAKLEVMQERNAQLLRELRDKDTQIEDVQMEMNRELRLRAETKLGKAKVEVEVTSLKKENAELKESLAIAETSRIKQQDTIRQYEIEGRMRDRAQALEENKNNGGEECKGNKIAEAVMNL